MKNLVTCRMLPPLERSGLDLTFQRRPVGVFGEINHAALFWDRGGLGTLERFRRVPDLHLLVLCLEGQADYVDERGERRVIRAGDVMLIPRGFAHTFEPTPGCGWSEIFAWFRGPLPDLWWRENFLGSGLTVLRVDSVATAAHELCRMFGKPASGSSSNDERISALQTWLVQTKHEAVPASSGARWFARACRALDTGTLREPQLEALATRLGLSYETFRKSFSAQAGTSPGQYRVAAVVEHAGRLLHRGLTSKEIAARLEFADEFHFARTFRQRMGMTPRQYRVMTHSR